MPRVVIVQYVLMAAAWVVAFVSWPIRAVELNGFLGWHWMPDTAEFVRLLFEQPRLLIQESLPLSPSHMLHTLWLSLVLIGFVFFILGVSLVRRRFIWGTTGQQIIRGFTLTLLALPLSLLAPASWRLPQPLTGMYLLAAAHVLMFVALVLMPAKMEEGSGFPVEPSR